jgi:hypothetical protein
LLQVATEDLNDGLHESAYLFVDYSTKQWVEIESLMIAVLVITIVLAAAYYYVTILPYIDTVRQEVCIQLRCVCLRCRLDEIRASKKIKKEEQATAASPSCPYIDTVRRGVCVFT